ncbi:hypothetical protein MKW92_007339 [Papaver armeniacum]|nr:hypothetical protein MKW92_007339 [Papaver armeniacum]
MGKMVGEKISTSSLSEENHHPDAFHVSGPTKLPLLGWRDIIISSRSRWKNENYRRTAMACFVQAVYRLELDRQENRTPETALAPKWWKPFKFKLSEILIDERDGSIFGAVLEWDGFRVMRPSGAPKAVLALRGTLLKGPTIRRDIIDDLRFLAWESLEGSVRFNCAFDVCNVCFAGHSLGAGFGLQVGKALAKQRVYVETHLFNPPSVTFALSLTSFGEKAAFVWKTFKWILPFSSGKNNQTDHQIVGIGDGGEVCADIMKWVLNLYVNNNDYICCNYSDPEMKNYGGLRSNSAGKDNAHSTRAKAAAAKLFVQSKGKLFEAHGLQQWWKDDLVLQLALNNSKLIDRQLKPLYYSLPAQAPPQWKALHWFRVSSVPIYFATRVEPA